MPIAILLLLTAPLWAASPALQFHLAGIAGEFAGLTNGSVVTPTQMPASITGLVSLRGTGAINFAAPPPGAYYTTNLSGTNANTSYSQFTGIGTQQMFDLRGPGQVHFVWTSRSSFANRILYKAGNPYNYATRIAFQASASHWYAENPDLGINTQINPATPYRLSFTWYVGGVGSGYTVVAGQEDTLFGNGVALDIKITWDGAGNAALLLNDIQRQSITYTRGGQVWSPTSSFAIGAQDTHFYGGFRPSDDTISDFKVYSDGPAIDYSLPTAAISTPVTGSTVSGVLAVQGTASDDVGVTSVSLKVDGVLIRTALTYPYNFVWDSRTVSDGAHTVSLVATDTSNNVATVNAAVTVLNAGITDTLGPEVVSGVRVDAITSTAIRFSWNPAVDNVGATVYYIYRDTVLIDTVLASNIGSDGRFSYQDTGRAVNTLYSYQVGSVDAASNVAPLTSPWELKTKLINGTTRTVGPGKMYATPCAAIAASVAWDTIEVDAAGNGTYDGNVCTFTIDNLTIRGVNGRARLDAAGANSGGKGTWVINGADNLIENIESLGARVSDLNGAAVRLSGNGITLRNVYFHHNQNNFLGGSNTTSGHSVIFEYSEFAYGGAGDGQSHNFYINNGATTFAYEFIMRYCYTHHASIGHLIKANARRNTLLYNRITDEDGQGATAASREIDLPKGGTTLIMGNVIQQAANSPNASMTGYGLEGLVVDDAPENLYYVNNTFISLVPNGASYFIHPVTGTSLVVVKNNIFADSWGKMIYVRYVAGLPATNAVATSVVYPGWARWDYHPNVSVATGAPPVIGGAPSLTPLYEYVHPSSGRVRIVPADPADQEVGAFGLPGPAAPIAPLVVLTSTLDAGTVGSAYTGQLSAAGGVPPYAWDVLSGGIPTGLTLNANGSITGSPSAASTFNFVARVTDDAASTATRSLSIIIAAGVPPPVLLSLSPSVRSAGGTEFTLTVTGANFAAGMTVYRGATALATTYISTSSATAIMPAALLTSVGNHSITVQLVGLETSAVLPFAVAAGPRITNSTLTSGVVGSAYSELLGLDGGNPPYTVTTTSGALPDDVILSSAGVFSGTPSVGGTFTFTVGVEDDDGAAYSYPTFITVTVPPPPGLVVLSAPVVYGSTVMIGYGLVGMSTSTTCTITSLDTVESIIRSQVVDSGGYARRSIYLTGLPEGVPQTIQVSCGDAVGSGTVTALAGIGGTASMTFSQTPTAHLGAVSNVLIEYGLTAGLGSTATASCAAGCKITVSGLARGSVYHFRRKWRDVGNNVLAVSRIATTVVR